MTEVDTSGQLSSATTARTIATGVAALLFAAMLGPLSAIGGLMVPAAMIAIALFALIYTNPEYGAYLIVGVGPLIVGIERGHVVPLLRLNEAVLGLVAGAIVARGLIAPRGRLQFNRPDLLVVLVATVGSVIPLVVRYSRSGAITSDEILAVAPLVKLASVYAIFRVSVRTGEQVKRLMMVALGSAVPVAMIGITQTLGLFGVRSVLTSSLFVGADSDIVAAASGRGTSTISSAIGAAGLYTICLAVNLCWRQLPDVPSRFLNFTAAALLVGIASTAQFTAVLALGSGTMAFIWLHRSDSRFDRLVHLTHRDRRRLIGAAAFASAIGVFTFGRRISPLLQGQLPSSWTVRWYNISTYFLPPLSHWGNVAWGVSPITQIDDPRKWVPRIWIESGYVWLFWYGGIAMVVVFILLGVVHGRSAMTVANSRPTSSQWSHRPL